MAILSRTLIGSAGLAIALAAATPAAAQYYPQQNNGGVLGAIINSVTGGSQYGQYPQGNYGFNQYNQRAQVAQCAAAAEQRLNGYSGQGYGGYNGNGYQQGYANQNGGARVVGITSVERRGQGGLRITGLATSGAYANQAYAYGNQGYGQVNAAQQADVRFTCRVNARGQVTDVNVNRLQQQPAYRRY